MAEQKVSLRIQLPPTEEMPQPEVLNYFTFSFFGPDVQLIAGYLDLRHFHEAKVNKEGVTAKPMILHRFLIPATGFTQLRNQIKEITKKYDEAFPPEPGKEEQNA